MTYSDKLKDPKWQNKRLEILNRDGFKCLACGDTKNTLHVHHCYYVSGREPWQYGGKALKTLCTKCHDAVHMRNESGEEESDWWDRYGKAANICDEFEQFNEWFYILFSDINSGGKTQPASHLILSTVRLLGEERFNDKDDKGGDTKSRSERLAKFYEAGMAGVFTDEFVQDMVRKTIELSQVHNAVKSRK
jgi:hypothetical protein